jgi:HTH-type transcriptional regulator / antitoxin HigA
MTPTIDPKIYGNLLAEYQPKVIKTDEENEQAIALAEKLAHRQNKTAEESALFEFLIALIEKYEDE